MNKRYDKIFSFFEEYFIKVLLSIIILFLVINHLILAYSNQFGLVNLNKWFVTTVGSDVINIQGTLLTIASIFIGIYFTVFTLLTTLNKNSTITNLTQGNFNKIVLYIRNSFCGAFGYIILSLLTTIGLNPKNIPGFYLILFHVLFIIYMILCSFRLGIIIYIAFKHDLANMKKNVLEEKKKEQEHENLMHRIEKVIADMENEKEKKQAEIVNQLTSIRNKKE